VLPAFTKAGRELFVAAPSKLHVMFPESMSYIGQKYHRRWMLLIPAGMPEEIPSL
jgi:hypothetical protein